MIRRLGGGQFSNDWQVNNAYRVRDALTRKYYDAGLPEPVKPDNWNFDPLDYLPRTELTINIYEDECNLIIDSNISLSGITKLSAGSLQRGANHVIRKPLCTFEPRIVDKYKKDVPLMPIQIPESRTDSVWINLMWNRHRYYDGVRDHTQNNTGEGWKDDDISVELIGVKYPIFYAPGYRGAEITLKVKYKSLKNQLWYNPAYLSATKYQELHNLNYEWEHTYKVWSRFQENNPGISYFISRASWGEYKLFAPHSADEPIAYVYIQMPKSEIENRWGEEAASFYRVQNRSYYSNIINEYEYGGSRDNRRLVLLKTPQRSYAIFRDIDNPQYDVLGANYLVKWSENIIKYDSWEVLAFESDYILPPTPPPPPPPPDKECDCMECCVENERLLRLILQRIGPVPATVPNSLVKPNSGTKSIGSLAEYIAYSVVQTNAQFGAFPQEINIQDADLTQEGDQSKKITLPNLAESMAEIIGILLVLQSESNANLIATVNAMIEAGSAKQLALLASDYAAANAEFLGYKGKQVEKKVAFTFEPGEPRLDRMLQPGEVKVKSWENDDKSDLNDVIMPLLEMAAMYRAQNFRNIGTGNTLEKLRDILKSGANIATSIDHLVNNPPQPSDPNAPPNEPPKSSWDEFIEQAETGFISKPGITDNIHPYGRPVEQRPKIREFGADTSEESNADQ